MTNKTVFEAILAMDSYNRGYEPKIVFPITDVSIGNAIISLDSSQAFGGNIDKDNNFYAISYNYHKGTPDTNDDEIIISYRGTDDPNVFDISADPWSGWSLGSGSVFSAQAALGAEFYREILAGENPFNGNVTFTGHSLGGGLAGLMASIYHQQGFVFDNMPFELSAANDNNALICEVA